MGVASSIQHVDVILSPSKLTSKTVDLVMRINTLKLPRLSILVLHSVTVLGRPYMGSHCQQSHASRVLGLDDEVQHKKYVLRLACNFGHYPAALSPKKSLK
ncbi:hypothetical protein KC363_g197 [Hortaea werneckii]|nr:hypothetical protein KC363_g197 [Hortaea werneckii]